MSPTGPLRDEDKIQLVSIAIVLTIVTLAVLGAALFGG